MNYTDNNEVLAFGSEMSFEELRKLSESYINKNLKESRKQHTLRVVDEGIKLAERFGADKEKVIIASLLHDMAKNLSDEEMDRLIDKYGIPSRYHGNPNLAHGKLAAFMIEEKFGIKDEELLRAVSYHTTGCENMSCVEKIVFLADAIEPGRTYPGVDIIREAAETSLDKACLISLNRTIDYISSKGYYLDPDTIKARDYLIKLKERNK